MKIGFLTTALSSAEEGGWGRYSRSLIESVSKHADVRVLIQKGSRNDSALKDVHAVLPRFSFSPSVQWKVYKECLKYFEGFDAVHVLIEPFAPGAAFASKKLGAKLLMTLHGTYSVPPKGLSIQGALLRYALKSCALTTTGSPQTEQKARERVSFGECRFIPNGVDLADFHPLPNTARKDFILTTGALKPRKGADTGVQALALLKDEFPNLRYVVIGDPSNVGFVEKVKALARQGGVEDKVEIRGLVSEEELLRAYNECKVYLLAARETEGQFEGFPMVYFEANACGTPVVTTQGFGSEYAVKNGENGYLVEQESPAQVAVMIRKLLKDPELWSRMSARAQEVARDHTWDRIAERFLLPMYRDAVGH